MLKFEKGYKFCQIILPGQFGPSSPTHSCKSVAKPVQGVPPKRCSCTISRYMGCSPLPQLTEHSSTTQSLHLQSTIYDTQHEIPTKCIRPNKMYYINIIIQYKFNNYICFTWAFLNIATFSNRGYPNT